MYRSNENNIRKFTLKELILLVTPFQHRIIIFNKFQTHCIKKQISTPIITNDPSPLHHLPPLKRLQSNLKKKHSAITSLNVLTILHLPETSPQSNPRGQRTSTRSKSLAASSEKRDDRARLPGSSTRLETCGWKKKEKERKREERRGEDNHRMPRRCATAYTASATTPVLTCRHIDIVIICKCGGARTRGASRRAATTHP